MCEASPHVQASHRSDSRLLFDMPEGPDFSMEMAARKRGLWPVAGTDEAGRGPLAGPVVAAAVVLDPGQHSRRSSRFQAELRPKEREALFEASIMRNRRRIRRLRPRRGIDTHRHPQGEPRCHAPRLSRAFELVAEARADRTAATCRARCLPCEGRAVDQGAMPASRFHRGAASIVAKVTRDRMMKRAGGRDDYPGYGFRRPCRLRDGRGAPHRDRARSAPAPPAPHEFSVHCARSDPPPPS
jgi:ribonuclease HII